MLENIFVLLNLLPKEIFMFALKKKFALLFFCSIWLVIISSSVTLAEDFLVEFQSIPTEGGCDFEHFQVDGEDFLAIANNRISSNQWELNSMIYHWNGTAFEEFQSIPTKGAWDWVAVIVALSVISIVSA